MKLLSVFRKGGLKANVLSMFISNLSYAFFSWAQLSLVSKFTNGQILGEYTLAIAIITPLYLFSNMQLRSLIITDHKNEFEFYDYFNFRVISNFLLILATIIIVFFIKSETPWIIILFALIKIIESNSEIINSFFQKKEQMHYVSFSVLFKSFFGFLGMLIGLWWFKDIVKGLLLSLIFNFLIYLFYDRRIALKNKIYTVKKKFDGNQLKAILKIAIPLGIVSGIISLNGNISKFFVEKMLGTEIQGIYSSISYLIILGTFVCNAVGASFAPRLSKYYLEKDIKAFKRLQNKFLYFNILLGILAWFITYLFGQELLLFFFNAKIASYSNLLNWVMIVGLFNYILTALGYTLTSIRAFKIQPKINLLNLFLKLILMGVFIEVYGLLGAIYSQLVVIIIQCIFIFFYIQRKVKMDYIKT